MPGAARTQATHTANESIEEIITRAHRERKHFGEAGRPNWFAPKRPAPEKYRTFDPEETVVETLERAGLSYEGVAPTSINDPVLVDAVARCPSYYVLFSGGGILRKDMLSLHKKFLHIHPGIVPDFKGEIPVHWSILLAGSCGASASFMADGLDEGDVIATRTFDPPEARIRQHTGALLRSYAFRTVARLHQGLRGSRRISGFSTGSERWSYVSHDASGTQQRRVLEMPLGG